MHFRKLQSGSSSVVWIDLVLLIYSSIDGHLGYFHFLTLEEDAAMNMGIQISLFDSAFHFFFFSSREFCTLPLVFLLYLNSIIVFQLPKLETLDSPAPPFYALLLKDQEGL